ncbi:type I inositol-1,4,5-trisphosphate 5-phosphatase 1 [Kwoniella heveanensis BCC8398]|uniref:Type I inositol-1,4,5-trisphosphate 5-phosphatase 1 n=1 Tax=Kwoniella heveanensis BCC8398 TaxID=1296120 RepID=A0A1B9H3I9_9TREE|nr:type I inositol-1,4,5-trisphosphate 5-phosphatase 1 [Kwoniella heveanensis BCC8398]
MSSGNEEDEAPRSIASLRSRFENLAAGNSANANGNGNGSVGLNIDGSNEKKLAASVVKRSFTPSGSIDLGRGKSGEAQSQTEPKASSISRPHAPVPRVSEPLAFSTTTSPPRPPSARLPPPGRPTTPKPAFQPPSQASTSSVAPTTGTVSAALASSGDTRSDINRLNAPSHTPLAFPSLSSGFPSQGPEPLPSAPTSPKPAVLSRRPPPAIPSKPSSVTPTPTGSDDGSDTAPNSGNQDNEEEEHIPSVKSLRERFNRPQPNVEASSSSSTHASLPRSASAGGQPAKPAATPMITKQISAPVIKRTSTGGKTTMPIPLSPAPESANEIVRSPSPTSLLAESSTASISNHRPAPPPPPISRSASPAPPAPNRASKPPPRNSPSPTPPPSRSTSSPGVPSAPESAQPTPPQLPQRRPTIVSSEPLDLSSTAPPPLPGTKPIFSLSIAQEPSSSPDGGPGPPPLPNRSRANTISRPEAETIPATSPAPPPPRLPARHATIAAPGIAPPPSHPSSPSRSRENTNDLPPPPPLRSALMNSAAVSSSPPRKRTSSSGDKDAEEYSEDEDDEPDETSPIAGLSATAKRLLEDFPDATEANRRPPNFTPDIRIKDCHHISAFAMFGRHVCTGAHHVRVYDTQLSDHPIFVVDLKETGLDHKVKDPRVTAMCFRPGATLAEEGRYLWCGTKDGHLWELDISTGGVSNTKSFAHTSAIAHIFRHQKMLLSLDETGKLLVYEVGDVEGKSPTLIRTLRVMEKFTFAKMICGKLWTSSGPAARSTTSASTSKGPTIRIYDPCAPGSMPPAKVSFTTEWTGQVTSATYIPLKPNTIYLGHEGGFVSLWDAKELTCIQVLKISTTDILALEGVGERLWAGNRKGQICVYDVEERPWLTINVWTGHVDNPVQLLLVDPFSIEHSGRYTCWSFARDSLRAWDGLLSVDWIDKQMVIRQPDYCTFRDINLLVVSWNIDSAKPTDLSGSEANVKFLEECLHSVDSPDIIVFGFQEVIPLTDKKITAKTLLFGGKNKDSSSNHDKVSQAYRQWLDKLTSAVRQASPPDRPYAKIHSESLVGLFTCIFVKSSEKDSLRDLDITTVKRGLGNIYGNKGAIVSRLIMDDTSVCFINVHLAAGQSQKAARNADLAAIMEDKAIFPASEEVPFIHGGNGTGILDHEMVFLHGDMNYRIDQRRENVISSIAAGELAYLLEHDQLRKEMRSNHAFRLRSFEEAPINFAPTYKYNPGTQDYDSSEKRRIPAWCDRILYRKSPRIRPINYKRYEPTVSDHRPISGGYTITLKAVNNLRMMDVRREVAGEWAEKERGMLMKMAEGVEGFA